MDDQRLEEMGRATFLVVRALLDENEFSMAEGEIRSAIREALSSQAGVCDECGNPLVPSEATWYHRACDEKRDDAKEAEVRSLREERDAERSNSLTAHERLAELTAELRRLREGMRKLLEPYLGVRIGDAMCDDCSGTLVAYDRDGEPVACPDCTPESPEEVGVSFSDLEAMAHLLASPVEKKSTKASDVLGTMDSEGPFVEPPGRPTSC